MRLWPQVLQAAFERQIAGLNHPGLIGATNTWVCQHPAMVHALEPVYPAGFEPVLLVQEMPRLHGSTLDTYVNQVRIMSFEQCLCSEVRPCQRWCVHGCDIAASAVVLDANCCSYLSLVPGRCSTQVPERLRPFACKQLLAGLVPLLKRAHGSKFVHHDLKLNNLMFRNKQQRLLGPNVPQIAIIDWGFSARAGEVPALSGGTLGLLSTDYLAGATVYRVEDDM